ncbi:16S rRNA methyltransferase [Chromobacterium violaceum]|uniref:16S rRNA (cytosine(967)-C(5))-methyltransferase RsmB n=1 Tax=Chromobacterium violaceum TaxID=536 RepID=UPI0006532554|nr:16S rRNA (cytosine(967)-C(5))-methyltransferase RsmB [Chromobacterium violaceum]KMN51445.1 16S rRNA methyltransferase [Chromobacterium violaceum]KMN86895.1 16S rRNA methyltransferase [Chromobacterium violaceum]KMN91948.1 16S rRNA methyltransferase [Chromobacterium violaceum]KMO05212.1 16S rRNA methyltransferase [Chromobacterium violaceum]
MYQIQQLAAEILARIEAGTTLTDALADAQRQAGKLTPAERGALQDLSYGSLRHLGVLRHCLRQLVPHPLPEPQVERLLLIALYQLQYTRAAQYAVVHEAVTLAGMMARGKFKALVNGVLRNFQRRRDELLANAAADEVAQANHPDWWVARLKEAYPAEWRAILEASNVHPPLTLRVNRRRISVDDYLRRLEEEGLAAKALGGDAVQLARPVAVRDLPGFAEGLASVQDEGAQRAAYWLDLKPGMRVLDACAAPGGKTGHMLEMADVEVTALDIDNARLARVGDNLRRLGLSAQLIEADASRPDEWWGGRPFDRILADVPCSASGVVRRHPDIKWLRRPGDFAALGEQQAGMADALWPLLASGGKMLYATCSIFPEENRLQLEGFLKRHPDASCLKEEQLLPCERHDGFYYALLEKH